MADNRKYYYLKLKENFFDSDSIVLLEDMKDGILYSNILLKLYLKSLKNGGKLQLDEHIPYTAQMIAKKVHVGFSCDHHLLFIKPEFDTLYLSRILLKPFCKA